MTNEEPMSERTPNAVTTLVQEHYEFLYRFAFRLSGSAADAEDLTQQTFLQAQRKFDQLRDPDSVRPWLAAILRNFFRKSLRQNNYSTFSSMEYEPEPETPLPEDTLFDAEQLQLALAELPEEFRTAIVLYYLEELSYKEIAESLEVPIGTVMSRLSRGKEYLRRRLGVVPETTDAIDH